MDEVEKMDAPKISIAGKEWPLPEFKVKQTIAAHPRVKRIGTIKLGDWSEDQIVAVYDLIFIALTASEPKLTREHFDDMAIPVIEAVVALPQILKRLGYDWVIKEKTTDGPLEQTSTGTA